MTDEDAQQILVERLNVPRETLDRFAGFVELLRREAERQNLVSRSSLESTWVRHILDSAQLVALAPESATSWLDLGTGAGFPGLIVAALHPARVTMVEQRKLRVGFLEKAAQVLNLPETTNILCCRAEQLPKNEYDVISARAFASLGRLLEIGERFAAPRTRWVLPKGRNARSELDAAQNTWQGMFHVEPSLTDPEAGIVVAQQVRRRGEDKKAL